MIAILNYTTEQVKPLTTAEFLEAVNKVRKENPHKWYGFVGTVNGRKLEYKGQALYVQIFTVNGWRCYLSTKDTIKGWKEDMENNLTSANTSTIFGL